MRHLYLLLIMLILLAGCATPEPVLPTKPAERLAKVVKSTETLTWVFIIAAGIAFMAMANGSKSAAGWLAASLFCLGLSLAVARYAEIMALTCMIGSGVWFFRSTLKRHGWLFNWCIRKKKEVKND